MGARYVSRKVDSDAGASVIDSEPGDLIAQRTSIPFENSPAALVAAACDGEVWLCAITHDRTKIIMLSRRAVTSFYSHTLAGEADASV